MPEYDANIYKHRRRYHHKKHYKQDNDEEVREKELFMTEYCENHKLDYGTINKYELAKQIGSRFYKEYYNAIHNKRLHM